MYGFNTVLNLLCITHFDTIVSAPIQTPSEFAASAGDRLAGRGVGRRFLSVSAVWHRYTW